MTASAPPRLEARGIMKSYGQHRVLCDVELAVGGGEVVGLLGENGAGKSTLTKILAGVVRQDAGRVVVDGREVSLRTPRQALREGIAFIPQELAVVPELTVAENILLGRWPQRATLTSQRAVRRVARQEAERFGFPLDVGRRMGSLKLAGRQLAEILRALVRRSSVILLDEPTSALTDREAERLLGVLRGLREQGVGIVYISHRLDEVYEICDRLAVLRNGRLVRSSATAETARDALVASMLGEELVASETRPSARPSHASPTAAPRLELRGWRREGIPALKRFDLTVRAGEIVGLFGLLGSGTEVVAEGLGGKAPKGLAGEVTVDGRRHRVFRSPREAARNGVAYLPADRKLEGLVLTHSTAVNLTLPSLRSLGRRGFIPLRRERALAAEMIRRFGVRARGPQQPAGLLSGGNQQKVLLASRLVVEPHVLVLHEPTRGVDVGARAHIHDLLRDAARAGTAIVMITSDLEEAVAVSDRLLVMGDGEAVAVLTGAERTQSRALSAAARVSS